MDKKHIVVVGAGASGLMSALSAKRPDTEVTLLEAGEKAGKKLLATGNGKCNFTYASPLPAISYRGSHPSFVSHALSVFPQPETLRFFERLGVMTQEKNGGCYPYTNQSRTVLCALLDAVQAKGICLKNRAEVTDLRRENGKFRVGTATWQYEADAVILACGSAAAPSLRVCEGGYALAQRLGHTILPVLPALVPLKTKETAFHSLSSVRSNAQITLRVGGRTAAQDVGELQWTSYGISGIVVFQVSRFAALGLARGEEVQAVLNLLPGRSLPDLMRFFAGQKGKPALRMLSGVFSEKLAQALLSAAGLSRTASLKEEETKRVLRLAQNLPLTVTGTASLAYAQACAGGVDTAEVDDRTMASKRVPGLYFAGEMLDIDGACGGYNLQWAWSSGRLAGGAAADFVAGKEKKGEEERL